MSKVKLTLKDLNTVDLNLGLNKEEVEKRKTLGLTNKISTGSSKSIGKIAFTNIFTFFNLINAVIAGLLLSTEDGIKDVFFLVIVTLNMLIGLTQEIRAKRIIDKLSLLSAPVATVLREGQVKDIDVSEVVRNDILVLKTGKQIIADAVVVSGFIEVDESLLTGESNLIEKKPGDLLYSGSFVASGTCEAEAIKVGKDAYIESLTSKAKKYKKPQSDLMRSLTIIVRTLGVMIVPIGLLLFNMQYNVLGVEMDLSIRKTSGAIIGMIPSGLMLLTSVALAVGVLRLAQNNTLVQELYCIELLARVDTLCLDKTGTITDGTMSIKSIIELNKDLELTPKDIIPQVMAVFPEKNQTSEALIDKFGVANQTDQVLKTIPFSSQRKYLAVTFKKLKTIIIGAPEFVLTKTEYNGIKKRVEKFAKDGFRVLVYAHTKNEIDGKKLPPNIKPLALILVEDNVRLDAISTIEYFKTHDVDVKVISGDNPITAAHIADRAGIINADKYISLDGLEDYEVIQSAMKYQVFGRVNPEQKRLLIETMKQHGKTVAMVGDGVNDILALKEADTSIAMASGSEAARNVSHLVLLDSDFSSMPKVVNEGRRVINNVQKVATLFLTKTIFSIILTLTALFLKIEYPITPSQLFLIDFLVIGIPAFFLSLQVNHDLVKGKFLSNVIKKALPGALAITLQVILIMLLFDPKMHFTREARNTIIVLTATFTGMVVLFRTLKPFTALKRLLFFVMFTISFSWVVFLPGFFEFNALFPFYLTIKGEVIDLLPFDHVLLLIVLIMSSPILIDLFANIPKWVRNSTAYMLKKLSGI